MARKKPDAREVRARELRAEIKRLTKKSSSQSPPAKQESPAAFVHRRMAELDAEDTQKRDK